VPGNLERFVKRKNHGQVRRWHPQVLRRLHRPLTVTMVLANVLPQHATRPRRHRLAHRHDRNLRQAPIQRTIPVMAAIGAHPGPQTANPTTAHQTGTARNPNGMDPATPPVPEAEAQLTPATAAASGCDDVLVLTIRFARGDDLQTLPDIERQTGEAFRALGMDAVADDDPLSAQHLAEYQQAGRAWVAEDGGQVVGYLLDVVAGAAHVEQVSVDPAHARRRIGSQLIDAAAAWARHHPGCER